MTPIFPSIEDIRAAYGGTVTRCGNRVLWSPNHKSAYKVVETCLGYELKPWFVREDAGNPPWVKPENEEKPWWEKCDWAHKNCVIADEFGVNRSTVSHWRKKLGKQ